MSTGETQVLDPASGPLTLDQLYKSGDHYAVLHHAIPLLSKSTDDANLALAVCRSYIALGLMGPAREMLVDGGSVLAALPEFQSLYQQIKIVPSARLPDAVLRERFAKNFARLINRHPSARACIDACRAACDDLEIYQTTNNNLLAARRDASGVLRWLSPFANTNLEAADVKVCHKAEAMFCEPYIITNDRFGRLLDRVSQATAQMYMAFRPRLYVVEPDAHLLVAGLHVAESIDVLCEDRVSLFVGPDCVDELVAELADHPERAIPHHLVGLPGWDSSAVGALEKAMHRVTDDRTRAARDASDRATSVYADATPASWAARFRECRGGGLRVLGLTSRFTTVLQYVMRDLGAAFESAGHTFRTVAEANDHDLVAPARYAAEIAEYRPDLVICIDHLRKEFVGGVPDNVPFLAWLQDAMEHLMRVESGQSVGSLEFYVAPSIEDFVRTYDYPESQGMVWTMAANDVVYSAAPMDELDLAPHRCDCSYVSNQSRTPESLRDEWLGLCEETPLGQRLVEYLYDALCNDIRLDPRCGGTGPAMLLLDRAKRDIACGPASESQLEAIVRSYIHPLSELLFRQRTLEWVADYCDRTGRTLHIYGQGWESHPRLAAYARGVAGNGHELRAIYQASKINLQITSYGAIHQRLLDGLSAGGFFLMRFCPNDVIHEPVRRLLAAIDEDEIQPDTLYQGEASPRVAAALAELPEIWTGNQPVGPGQFLIPRGELSRYQEYAATRYCRVAGAVFEPYDQLSFGSGEEFAAAADRFLEDADARARVVAEIRPVVLQRYSYSGLVGRLLEFIESRLADAG